jgi:hypothetical protein
MTVNREQRREARRIGIEMRQSQGKSARFLIHSDKVETWMEENTCCHVLVYVVAALVIIASNGATWSWGVLPLLLGFAFFGPPTLWVRR